MMNDIGRVGAVTTVPTFIKNKKHILSFFGEDDVFYLLNHEFLDNRLSPQNQKLLLLKIQLRLGQNPLSQDISLF